MTNKDDLAVALGWIEEQVVSSPTWEELKTVDPDLWDKCSSGYESIALMLIKVQECIDKGDGI